MDKNEIVARIGIIRTRANLSARELSMMIGKSPGYINKLETSKFNLTIDALLDIIYACNSSPEEFSYGDINSHKLDKEIILLLNKSNADKKQAILSILKN